MKIDYNNPIVEAALQETKKQLSGFDNFSQRLCGFISKACDFSFEPTESDLSEGMHLIRSAHRFIHIIDNMEFGPEPE